jgi:hypothetical protein
LPPPIVPLLLSVVIMPVFDTPAPPGPPVEPPPLTKPLLVRAVIAPGVPNGCMWVVVKPAPPLELRPAPPLIVPPMLLSVPIVPEFSTPAPAAPPFALPPPAPPLIVPLLVKEPIEPALARPPDFSPPISPWLSIDVIVPPPR